ncbi:2OG-Fe(II) oxygenase [Sorangium sp. So ce375]|uniref:2OG-Fe(II) oxygenase n=1 Tax=Sorangium sp. So ce375 TaxID=3133306 RepID=UPI003F5C0331
MQAEPVISNVPSSTGRPDRRIMTQGELDTACVTAITSGAALAVRLPGFIEASQCGIIKSRLIDSPLFGRYANAPDIGRVGQAFFETIERPDLQAAYYAQAIAAIRALRMACAPWLAPFDKLRVELADAWTGGVRLETLDDQRPMFAGLVRVFEGGAEAVPHQDVLSWDAPGDQRASSLTAQLAANIYVCSAERGGELELWPTSYGRAEYDARRAQSARDSYGLDRSLLDGPAAVLQPEVGELILFDSTRLHAVRPSFGQRVTVSCFIGFRGDHEPLTIWS